MTNDMELGCDGLTSDEMTTTYLRRGDALVERSDYDRRERAIAPAEAAAELDRMAAVSREMADLCRSQGLDGVYLYSARAVRAERTAAAIRRAFAGDSG